MHTGLLPSGETLEPTGQGQQVLLLESWASGWCWSSGLGPGRRLGGCPCLLLYSLDACAGERAHGNHGHRRLEATALSQVSRGPSWTGDLCLAWPWYWTRPLCLPTLHLSCLTPLRLQVAQERARSPRPLLDSLWLAAPWALGWASAGHRARWLVWEEGLVLLCALGAHARPGECPAQETKYPRGCPWMSLAAGPWHSGFCPGSPQVPQGDGSPSARSLSQRWRKGGAPAQVSISGGAVRG